LGFGFDSISVGLDLGFGEVVLVGCGMPRLWLRGWGNSCRRRNSVTVGLEPLLAAGHEGAGLCLALLGLSVFVEGSHGSEDLFIIGEELRLVDCSIAV